MGIAELLKKTKPYEELPNFVFDASEGVGEAPGTCTLTFREPNVAERFEAATIDRLKADFPEMAGNQTFAYLLNLMAFSYVPSSGEQTGKFDALAELVSLARVQPSVYMALMKQFSEAFPDRVEQDIKQKKAELAAAAAETGASDTP